MRVIKFRVWNPKYKVLVQSSDCDSGYSMDVITGYLDWNGNTSEGCILQQFTGLSHSSGREIYEGDILEWTQIHCRKEYPNQKSVNDFINPIFVKEEKTVESGEVVFGIINDVDDFYCPYVSGWGVKIKVRDTLTSLHQLLQDFDNPKYLPDNTYGKILSRVLALKAYCPEKL